MYVVLAPFTLLDDEAKNRWQIDQEVNGKDWYGRGILKYMSNLAHSVEEEMEKGYEMREVISNAMKKADTMGMSGASHGVGINVLCQIWIHGDKLRELKDERIV